MKILFLSNRGLLPIKDGHTRRSYNILKGLAEHHQIHFASLYETDEEISDENHKKYKSFCRQVEFFPAPPKHLGFSMISRFAISLISMEAYSIWRHYSPCFRQRIRHLINFGQFDIVHCDILPICYAIRHNKKVFRSLTDHDVSYIKLLRTSKTSKNYLIKALTILEAIKIKRLEKKVFTQVDVGIAVSQSDKNILEKICPRGNFIVIENGVEAEVFAPSNVTEDEEKLVWIGGFDHPENRQAINYFFQKIYKAVKKHHPNVRIDIIGGGIRNELKEVAKHDSTIRLLGYIDEPLPFLQKASVFIAPILSGGGTKLKVLEAMSVGKAIVSTTIGCEGIEGFDGRHFVIADDENTFAKSIVHLLKDQKARENLGKNARKLICEKYDYRSITTKLSEYYSKCVPYR